MSGLLTRAQRLDELPYTAKHNKLLFGSGVGWALDAMDIGLISFIMAALAATFFSLVDLGIRTGLSLVVGGFGA